MKKTTNIVLISIVIGLWGTIIYKYLKNYFSFENTLIHENGKIYSLIKINERDTFSLTNLNRDPFLGKITKKYKPQSVNNNSSIKINNKTIKPISSKIPTTIPTIQYFGIIKSSNKKDELVILKINNVVQKLRLNSEYNGVKIKKIFKDSIMISFDKKEIIIKMN